MAILEVKGLRKSFGGVQAVAGVDLQVSRGQIQSVIGPNGAGKSTLFNLISGYYRSDEGSIFFKDEEITHYRPQKIVKMGMGRSFQVTKIFPRLTVFENVQAAVLYSKGYGFNFFSDSRRLVVRPDRGHPFHGEIERQVSGNLRGALRGRQEET